MPTAQGRLHYYYGLEQIRCLASWIVTAAATVVLGTIGIVVSFVDFKGNVTHACARSWARTMLWIHGVRLTVAGLENLEPERTYVFVANHNSALDIPALLVALPGRFRMFAKSSLFRIPFLGWYMRRVGYVPVPRDGTGTDIKGATGRLLGTTSMLVFPEGTRTGELELARFRKGGFHLARAAGVQLVPIAVINSGRLLPRGKVWVNLGEIEVRVGAPIRSDGSETLAELAALCRERVAELPR
jgi:1-acyl-sn-glycerol-3-phosphate acyltransferase